MVNGRAWCLRLPVRKTTILLHAKQKCSNYSFPAAWFNSIPAAWFNCLPAVWFNSLPVAWFNSLPAAWLNSLPAAWSNSLARVSWFNNPMPPGLITFLLCSLTGFLLRGLTGFLLRGKGKGKVFYGQEPPSGESTTTECGFNYQLLAVIYWNSPMGSS